MWAVAYASKAHAQTRAIEIFMSGSLSRRAFTLLGGNGGSKLILPRRTFSYPKEPLTQAIDVTASRHPDAATQPGQSVSPYSKETRVTKLENGLRVASQEAFGQYSTIGGESEIRPRNHSVL